MVGICADKHGLVSIFSIGLVLSSQQAKSDIEKVYCFRVDLACYF